MPKGFQQSLSGWAVLVTVPLVVLAVLAAIGINARKTEARAKAQKEASVVSVSQASVLSQQLRNEIVEFTLFPDPPVPGMWASRDETLDEKRISKLEQLRDDPDAGISYAGLPRRALAALRIEYLAPGKQDPKELMKLLTEDAPSVLSLPAIKRLQKDHPGLELPPEWKLVDRLNVIRSLHPDGGWVTFEDEVWWLSPDRKKYLPPSALSSVSLELPPYATPGFSTNGKNLVGPENGELLARAAIEFPSPLYLDWILTSPDEINASVRQETHWILALLGTSLVASACGLFAIVRLAGQERRLGSLKSQFVSSVSHELRAPLGSIQLMANALEEERVESPKEFHSLIGRECQRMSHLIENVLDFARIEEGRRHYNFEETELAALVTDSVELFTPVAKESGHTFKLSLESGSASVDRVALQQAVANLIDNALKFSPPDTEVSVLLGRKESSWNLSISDEGPGIPEAERERIFERFHRLGDELRRETKGTGIGLSLVKHIAEAHGGTVAVANHPTTFTINAPIHPQEQS